MKNIFKKIFHIHKFEMILCDNPFNDKKENSTDEACKCGVTRHRVWIGALFGYWSRWKYRKPGAPFPQFREQWKPGSFLSIRNLLSK